MGEKIAWEQKTEELRERKRRGGRNREEKGWELEGGLSVRARWWQRRDRELGRKGDTERARQVKL